MKDWETRTFVRQPLQDAARDKLTALELPAEKVLSSLAQAEATRRARFFDSVEVRHATSATAIWAQSHCIRPAALGCAEANLPSSSSCLVRPTQSEV